jgi:hypothetical protein
MNKPQIQTFFEQQKKSISNKIAFLGIGAGAILFNKHLNWIAPIIIGAIIPMVVDLKEVNDLIKNKSYESGTRFTFFLNKSLKKWTDKYINSSDSLVDKKYKTLFLQLWCEHKETSFDDIIYSNSQLFKDLSQSLISEGITKNNLFEMMIDSSKSVGSNGERVVIKDFFLEDLNNPERLAIAKKVFEEYQDIGLIGKSFLRRSNYDALLHLQNYKFSEQDYEIIKKHTEDLENGKNHFAISLAHSSINYHRYQDLNNEIANRLIDAEDNPNKLKILNRYYDILIKRVANEAYTTDSYLKLFNETNEYIKAKIDYLELSNEVNQTTENNKNIKRPKL